jgi:flagellar motor switch protein FliM
MSSPASPADTRAYILERLVGDMGEPDQVIEAGRMLGEKAGAAIEAGLLETLAVAVSLELKTVELARLADAKPQGAGHAMTVAASASSTDVLVLTLDPAAVAVIVSTLFGGDPSIAAAPIRRVLSPTELQVASLVFEEVAKAVNGTSTRGPLFTLPLPATIAGPDLDKLALRDGPSVRLELTIATTAGAGRLSLTMPQRVLVGQGASTEVAPAGSGEWGARFGEEIMRSTVDLQATMPLRRMTLGEIADLAVGSVIELEAEAQSHAKLSARQQPLFICELGKLGQNYTVRIRHPFDAGQDFIDGLISR